jgi:hypothetical protein
VRNSGLTPLMLVAIGSPAFLLLVFAEGPHAAMARIVSSVVLALALFVVLLIYRPRKH